MVGNHIYITPALLAVYTVERGAAEVRAATSGEQDRWLFAIVDLHMALNAALVETVSGGSTHIGSLSSKHQKAWIDHFESPGSSPPSNARRVESLSELLSRAFDSANASGMGGTLVLSNAQRSEIGRLNDLRDELVHVKPELGFIEASGLPRIVRAAAEALRQLFDMRPVRHHLDEDVHDRGKLAIASIFEHTAPPRG
jgi:hypothetical protein